MAFVGLAFAVVVDAFVVFLVDPLISLIVGQPDLTGIDSPSATPGSASATS